MVRVLVLSQVLRVGLWQANLCHIIPYPSGFAANFRLVHLLHIWTKLRRRKLRPVGLRSDFSFIFIENKINAVKMKTELDKLNALVDFLNSLVGDENYQTIYHWLSQNGNFRAGAFPLSKGAVIYRSRQHRDAEIGKMFTNSSEIGYNRCENWIEYNRCNKPKQRIGYYSQTPIAACLEVIKDATKGEIYEITVGAWSVTNDINLKCLIDPNPENAVHEYDKLLREWYEKELNKYETGVRKLYDAYFSRFNEIMSSELEGFGYQITAAYANKCYEISDGIAYRSIVDGKAYNVAMKKEIEDSGMIEIENVCKVKFQVLKDKPRFETDLEFFYRQDCTAINLDRKAFSW